MPGKLATPCLKEILKRNLSERQWEQLSCLKTKFTPPSRRQLSRFAKSSLTDLCLRYIELLPTRDAVSIKERIKLVERLDYTLRDIYINLDSSAELMRLKSCEKEPETVDWIETHIRPGDVLYDIGANVGAYSFVASAVSGGDCTIYAFEPSFSTFASLCQNVILNKCQEKVIPLNLALADETKLFALNYSSIASGVAMHGLGKCIDDNGEPFQPAFIQPILTYRLDDLVHEFGLRPANHIKIDVDGGDLNVLRGAEKTLTRPDLRSLLIEVDEQMYQDEEIPSFLIARGFRFTSKHPRVRTKLFNCIFER